MNVLSIVALLTYTFGAFAYAAIVYLWVTETEGRRWTAGDRRDGAPPRELDIVKGALVLLSLAWFCCNAGLVLYRFVPRRTPWPLDLAAVHMAFLFPPVIMHVTLAEVAARDSVARSWRAGLWPAYAAAVAVPAWALFVVAPSGVSGSSALAARVLGYGACATFLVAAAFSMSIIARHGGAPDARSQQSRRWTLRLFGLMAVVFALLVVIGYVTDRPGGSRQYLSGIAELAAKSLPLIFMFVGTYNESPFKFFDLFVKRGASMIVTLATLTATFAVALPVLRPLAHNWAAPWLFAVILLPVALAIPWANRHLAGMLDRRWLGRRYTAVDAITHFLGCLRSATSETQLREQAQRGLRDIFSANADVLIGDATPAAGAAAQDIPVRSGNRIVGRFIMGPRASEAPYFSQDIVLLRSLADVFAHVLENLHLQERRLEQEHRAQQLSLHASRSELKALRAQINPHFLFNALNSIAGLIHREPEVADRTIEQLADVFRYALRGAESEWAVLDDELDFVRAYLEVERARFGSRLQTAVKIDDAVRGARVPTMMLQTLVENAVKHGVASVRGNASVVVTARQEAGCVLMSVNDNGPGFREGDVPAPVRGRGGYGLVNIRQRLEGYFGAAATLSVDCSPGTTTVSITLPLLRQEPRPQQPERIAR
jgi:hypothetical protein